MERLLLLAVQLVGVRVKPYKSDLSCTIASLHDFRKDVKHASSVAAYGVVGVLLFVAFQDIRAPFPVNGEIYPGKAPLGFPTKVDRHFALESDAGIREEAGQAFLFPFLPLLATRSVDAALVLGQVSIMGEACVATSKVAFKGLLSCVNARCAWPCRYCG